MSKFGWSLPPGCTQKHIDDHFSSDGEPCQCCGLDPYDCICPQCPICSDVGNPHCYSVVPPAGHGLKYTRAQLIGQAYDQVRQAADALYDAEQAFEHAQESLRQLESSND